MPKPKKNPFHVYEDREEDEPPCCSPGVLCSLCHKGCTALNKCSPQCRGCPHCGNLLHGAAEQEPGTLNSDTVVDPIYSEPGILTDDTVVHPIYSEPGILTDDTVVHPIVSAVPSNSLFRIPSNNEDSTFTLLGPETLSQVSSNNESTSSTKPAPHSLFQISSSSGSLTSTGSDQFQSISTTDATKSSTPSHISFSNNEHQSNTTPTPARSIYQLPLRNKSPDLTGGKNLFHSPTRDLVDQQRSSRISGTAARTRQPCHNTNRKSSSLTGSQDSLIASSPTRTLVDQRCSPRASQPVVRTHAEKLRAALACPVDELPIVKPRSAKNSPLKKKMGSLWKKVQFKFDRPLAMSNHQLIPSNDDLEEKILDKV